MLFIQDKINLDGTFNCINCINIIFPILYVLSLLIILSYDFYSYTAFIENIFLIGFLAQFIFYFVCRKVKNKIDENLSILSFSVYLTGIFYYIDFLFFMQYIKQFVDMHEELIHVIGWLFKEFFEATLPNDARTIYIYILVSLSTLFAFPILYLVVLFIMAFVSFLAIIIPSLNLLNMFFIMYLSGIYYCKYGVELYRQIKYGPISEESLINKISEESLINKEDTQL